MIIFFISGTFMCVLGWYCKEGPGASHSEGVKGFFLLQWSVSHELSKEIGKKGRTTRQLYNILDTQ